jgi:predicted site-specific integrase-resolvase
MKSLTTAEAAERLGVAQVTVNVWCLRGLFPNAVRQETARGPVWIIPESDVSEFVKPKRGRVPKPKGNGAAPSKRAKKGGRK